MMKMIFHIKFSKTQLFKIAQSEGFIGRLFGPLLKIELLLIGNVLKLLAKSILIPLGLRAAATMDTAIGSGHPFDLTLRVITLIITNKEMNDIPKIVISLDKSGLLIKGIGETIKKEANERKGGFLRIL